MRVQKQVIFHYICLKIFSFDVVQLNLKKKEKNSFGVISSKRTFFEIGILTFGTLKLRMSSTFSGKIQTSTFDKTGLTIETLDYSKLFFNKANTLLSKALDTALEIVPNNEVISPH